MYPCWLMAAGSIPTSLLKAFPLTNVTGTCGKGITLANVKNAVLRNIKVTGFEGPLLSTYHVTGSGLTGAATLPPPKVSDPILPAATPFTLH